CGEEVDVETEWMKIPQGRLVDRAVANAADRRESLQQFAVRILGAGRVEGKSVAGAHALEGARLAVIDLHEAAGDAQVDVVFRYDTDPVRTRAHPGLPCMCGT